MFIYLVITHVLRSLTNQACSYVIYCFVHVTNLSALMADPDYTYKELSVQILIFKQLCVTCGWCGPGFLKLHDVVYI